MTPRERLLLIQVDAELERKARKAARRQNIWTAEELEAAARRADRILMGTRGFNDHSRLTAHLGEGK